MSEDNVLKEGPFKGYKVTFESTKLIEQHREAVDKVLEAIEDAMDIESVFVTDRSKLRDFKPNLDELTAISEKLGIPVSEQDLICDIAMRLSPKN